MPTQATPVSTDVQAAQAVQAAVTRLVIQAFEPGSSLFGGAPTLDERRALAETGVDCLLAMLSRASLPLPAADQKAV